MIDASRRNGHTPPIQTAPPEQIVSYCRSCRKEIVDTVAHTHCPDNCGIKLQPFQHDTFTGKRRPNVFAPAAENGENVKPLTWLQQWRLLETIRQNPDFRYELLDALGLGGRR